MAWLNTREPILKRYIAYICICFLSLASLIGLHMGLEYQVDRFEGLEDNEQVKNTISLIIQKRILMVQNQFQYMTLASSNAELEMANETVSANIDRVKKAILVLENGGQLTENFFVNFGNRENIDQTLTYAAPVRETVSLSAIEMKTNLIRLEESRKTYFQLVRSRMNRPDTSGGSGDGWELTLYHKTIAPFFQRVIENSNRLYFESLNALHGARQAKQARARLYNTLGAGLSLLALTAILGFGFWIIRGIVAILSERKAARDELVAANETLEIQVMKRTDSLRAEVAERRKTENEMTRQARFLTTVIESLNHPFYVIDVDTHEIIIANKAAREGRDAAKTTCHQLTHLRETPCDGVEHPCPIHMIRETGKPVVTEHLHYDQDGNRRNVEVYGYPIFDDTGRIIQIIEYALDITEKKQAQKALKKSRDELEETVIRRTRTLELEIEKRKRNEEMQKKLLLAVEQNPNTVVITDTAGIIEYVNPAFEKNSGYTYEEAIGKNPNILNSGKVPRETFARMWDTLTRGEIWKGEFINRKKTGELYNENVVVVPLKSDAGKITHFVAIKENITELIRAREQAEAATLAKSRFLANMSHEIRTPMNAIIGMSHLALATDLSPKQHAYIRKIQISANSLLDLINAVLDFSKIEANRLELEQVAFNILSLMEQVGDLVSVRPREKEAVRILFDISADIPETLVGDPLRLRQILLNLGSNAVKFTRQGEVTFRIGLVRQEPETVFLRFCVDDTGIGIPPDKLQGLFQAFSQADASTTRQYGGTGLGLAICRRLISLMGGEIRVESTPGRGSRFWFDIGLKTTGAAPLKERYPDISGTRIPDPAAGRQPGRDGTSGYFEGPDLSPEFLAPVRGARLLLAEDNEINRAFAQELLKKAGFFVTIAENGRAAVDLVCTTPQDTAGSAPFDAVLMDIQMPVMDGYQATREIRTLYAPEALPVIAMSASILNEDRDKAAAAGMNDYIAKPIDIPALHRALVRWIPPADRLPPPDFRDQKAAAQAPLPSTDPVNLAEGLERAGGNRALYREIRCRFRQHHLDTAQTLHRLLAEEQTREAGRILHQIKGEAGNIGAKDLHGAAAALEAGLAGHGTLADALDRFDAALGQVLEFLEQTDEPGTAAAAPEAKQAETADAADLIPHLDPLLTLLRQGNLSKSRLLIAQLNEKSWPGRLSGEIRDITGLVSRYRFREAAEKVQALVTSLTPKE